MRTFSALVAICAGLGTAILPVAASAEDALRDAVTEQQRQSEVDDSADSLPEPVLLSEEDLDSLVAPVALYPDALLAQVLVAATFPLQVVDADRFLTASTELSDADAAAQLEQKPWDPSVMVLASGFPTVVHRMSEDLDWTDRLGRAMVDQDDDVLAAVQRKRAEAKETGYLADNAAQTVETDDAGAISIAPANPEVVYVPSYDATAAYTTRPTAQPYVTPVAEATSPGFQPNPLVTGAIAFGAALLVSQLFGSDRDDDNDEGWDDYWHRRQFDWHDRHFYPRPRWQWSDDRPDHSWGWERDRYWDPGAHRWHRDGPLALRAYDDDRRDTLGWLVVRDPERHDPWVRGFERRQAENDRARRQAERQAAERRQARLEAERREDRRARQAEEAREARIAAERREERQKAAAEQARADRHDADARRKAQAERREQAHAKSEADARRKAQAERRAKAEADAKAAADADARRKAQAERRTKAEADSKAKAEADAQRKAQAERRAKAQADGKAKAEADAQRKAQAERRAKAQADGKAKAEADAQRKAQAERRAKAQADGKAKAEADAQRKTQAERRAQAQADAKAKAEADARRQAQAAKRAKAEARQSRPEPKPQRQAKCKPNDEACRQRQ